MPVWVQVMLSLGLAGIILASVLAAILRYARPPKEDGISDDYDAPLKRPANGWGDEKKGQQNNSV